MSNHLFVVPAELGNTLTREEVTATVEAMKQLGLYHLPYDRNVSLRILYGKRPIKHPAFREIQSFEQFDNLENDGGQPVYKSEFTIPCSPDYFMKHHARTAAAINADGLPCERIQYTFPKPGRAVLSIFPGENGHDTWGLGYAEFYRNILIVLLASKGVNKSTKAIVSGKAKLGVTKNPTVNYVTTMTLAPDLPRGDATEARPGKPVRPHLRRGHIRSQHHGPHNLLIKQIWIAPTMVNADEEFISTRTAYRFSV